MSVREGVLACVCVYVGVCPVVCQSMDRLERRENKKETDTNRQYMFLICPPCEQESGSERERAR